VDKIELNKDIVDKITGIDIHVETLNGERKVISYSNFLNTMNDELLVSPRGWYNPFHSLDLHIECTNYDLEYYDDIKGEEQTMNNEDVITKKVARQILSMIETICFSEEFKEYRLNNGSNGTRDLIIENIKKTYSIG